MSAPCPSRRDVLRWTRLRERDEITREEQAELTRHLASCRVCDAEARALDPTLLFSALSVTATAAAPRSERDVRIESEEAQELASSVAAAIQVSRARRRIGRAPSGVLRAASVGLVAAVLTGVIVAKHRSAPVRDTLAAAPATAPLAAAPASADTLREPAPLIEDVGSPAVRVYQFAGNTPKEPSVVFVANPGADI